MDEKEFELDAGVFTVHISYFQGPVPGKLSGPPEDCYPDEGPEVEFDPMVDWVDGDNTEKSIDLDEFVKIYAKEFTEGDIEKAIDRIENEVISEILEAADEYEP